MPDEMAPWHDIRGGFPEQAGCAVLPKPVRNCVNWLKNCVTTAQVILRSRFNPRPTAKFACMTAVAKAITGQHVNGRRFFGLYRNIGRIQHDSVGQSN